MSAISEATGIEKHVPTSLAKADDIQEKAVDKAHNLVDAINTTNKCIEQLLNAIKNENQAAQEASKAFGDAFGAYETTNNMVITSLSVSLANMSLSSATYSPIRQRVASTLIVSLDIRKLQKPEPKR